MAKDKFEDVSLAIIDKAVHIIWPDFPYQCVVCGHVNMIASHQFTDNIFICKCSARYIKSERKIINCYIRLKDIGLCQDYYSNVDVDFIAESIKITLFNSKFSSKKYEFMARVDFNHTNFLKKIKLYLMLI